MTELFTLSRELGFTAAAPVNMSALTPLEEVRAMCEADRCGRYGRSWACPPGCGTLEHTRARIEMYSEGILVQSTAELADEFDYQGIMRLTEEHKRRFADFARQARLVYPDCLPLTARPKGEGWSPAATSPAMWAISTMKYAPTSCAAAAKAPKSMMRL